MSQRRSSWGISLYLGWLRISTRRGAYFTGRRPITWGIRFFLGRSNISLRIPRNFFRVIITVLILLFVVFYGLHFIKTTAPIDSGKMTINDIRVLAKCPHKPANIWEFINRSRKDAVMELSRSAGKLEKIESGKDFRDYACE